jgi:hypothetical protein
MSNDDRDDPETSTGIKSGAGEIDFDTPDTDEEETEPDGDSSDPPYYLRKSGIRDERDN